MTKKQRIFCEQYLKLGDGVSAAIAAGYSVKSAHATSSRLLSNREILSHLEEKRKEAENVVPNNPYRKYVQHHPAQ